MKLDLSQAVARAPWVQVHGLLPPSSSDVANRAVRC